MSGKVEALFAKARIHVNGSHPWDMQLRSPGVLERIASRGSIAMGESYVDGDWEAERLDEFFAHILRARLDREARPLNLLLAVLRERVFNRQSFRRAWQVGETHYDLGNEFYQAMLGPRMAYTCGYWTGADSLNEAQDVSVVRSTVRGHLLRHLHLCHSVQIYDTCEVRPPSAPASRCGP